jgi:hypothetical protein
MSRKNRAFALAVTTAALVGLSAPVASAASFAGPSGFNNDSILNLSGNQLPVQTCTGGIQTNTDTSTQTVTSTLNSILPVLGAGAVNPMQASTCTQSPSQASSVMTNTAPMAMPSMSMAPEDDPSSGPNGFNNDSILNVSGNQLPVQTCTGGTQTTPATTLQTVTAGLNAITPILGTGAFTPAQANNCVQSPSQANTSSVNS